ncbi:tyrosine-type recombinase/integrase [Pseudonocardia saturnea]
MSTGMSASAWTVTGPDGVPVVPVDRFLREFAACGNSAGSARSYAGALLRWWRFLLAVDVVWDRATPVEGRDFVLWLRQARKPIAGHRTVTATTAGRVNPITRKPALGDGYALRTIRHNNAVVRSFYEFFGERGEGPLLNPMPRARAGGLRAGAHHNPMQPFGFEGRLRYNPKVPHRRRRALTDLQWDALFGVLRSDRDRALLALAVSTAARAAEILGLRAVDLDWGAQTVQVRRKGSGAAQWLPASTEAFVWLRLWIAELGEIVGEDPVWQTLRRRRAGADAPARSALTYDALRAMLRRANTTLGTNWTMHDLRHTCALRLLRGTGVSVRDVQVILGHAHLSTTQIYLDEDDSEVIARVHRHLAERAQPPALSRPASGYDPADLAVLLGGDLRAEDVIA